MRHLDTNEHKKRMCQLYNEISKELFGFGTTLLRATVDGDIVTLVAKHRRSPRSDAMEKESPGLKLEVDFRMSLLYKKKFREKLETEMELSIDAVLRDYDSATQWAITNVILRSSD
ncbi:DUF2294 domain-containing protein [Cohnella lupini]|uniref:DUF2294 domain-containing protein n=1 Tax=Cohnella lupini TaxID=1294267 RepID=A0A3D9IA00_9BACL|nr:DUF2294 domain-containing protein [Cohnella lupini]RED58541.1 hypothetical protein DFP95_10867 [Cohnella lupini]